VTAPLPPDDLALADEVVGDRWERLRGASILLTGSTGFFGIWLLESLREAERRRGLGIRVAILSRDPERFRARFPWLDAPGWRWIGGDARSFSAPGPYTHAILGATAASASLNAERPDEMLDVIVDGTRRGLEVAGGARVLLVSSGAVYGVQPPDVSHLPEEARGGPDPLDPGAAYGVGKLVAEHLLAQHGHRTGAEWAIARAFAFSGPHLPLDSHFALGNFVRDAAAGRPVVVAGDGTPFRSYLYAAELAGWLWTLLAAAPSGRAWNVGSDEAVTIRALAEACGRVGGVPVEVRGTPRPGVPAARYVPSVARIGNELGLRPRLGLEAQLRRMVDWVRTAPAGSPGYNPLVSRPEPA